VYKRQIVLPSSHWSNDKQKVTTANPNYGKINARLKYIKSQVNTFLSDVKINKRVLTYEDFKYSIDSIISPDIYIGKPDDGDNGSIIDHLEYFIDKKEKQKALRSKTLDKYKYLLKHLIEFSRTSKKDIHPMDMNHLFYDSYTHFLFVHKNMVNNTVGTDIQCLKTFLSNLEKEGIRVNPEYREFKKHRDTSHMAIALTEEDIQRIKDLELTEKQLIETRDLLIIQLHTAQRVSDLMSFKKEQIDFQNNTIRITQIKTGNKVVLPLTVAAKTLFEKYDFRLPVQDKASYNRNLKKLCRLAGLEEQIETVKPQGHMRQILAKPKYELVSSHTIRRTAITLLLRKGVLPEYVMKVSGIKTYSVFQQYIKLSNEEAADAVREIWDL